MIKSFRGLLVDGGQEKIRLTTTDGRMGYKITKVEVMPNIPGTQDYESVVQIFTTEQASVPTDIAIIDFSNLDTLAAVFYESGRTSESSPGPTQTVVFETEIFNQDIYITHTATSGSQAINYYIELEQIKLSSAEAELLIVKDLRKEMWTRP